MMKRPLLHALRPLLMACVCTAACTPALADSDTSVLPDSMQLGGKSLRLNGAGIGVRLFFKVYAMGLYLLDHKASVHEVLTSSGPRRMFITMLRDVSSDAFDDNVLRYMSSDGEALPAPITASMLRLGKAINNQGQGLRKGDTLTLDWVPGTGTVIELNQKALMEPIPEIGFYNALLNIWLGEKPTDPALKTKLLGRPVSVAYQ
jgi:hypothetical protein